MDGGLFGGSNSQSGPTNERTAPDSRQVLALLPDYYLYFMDLFRGLKVYLEGEGREVDGRLFGGRSIV